MTVATYENPYGGIEPVPYMSRQRLRAVRGLILASDYLTEEQPDVVPAIEAEQARRAAYLEALKPTLVEAGYTVAAIKPDPDSGLAKGYRAYKRMSETLTEAVLIPDLERAEWEEDAWAAIIRHTPEYRDPAEIAPA